MTDAPSPAEQMFQRKFNTQLTLLGKKNREPHQEEKSEPVWIQDQFTKEWAEAILTEAVEE